MLTFMFTRSKKLLGTFFTVPSMLIRFCLIALPIFFIPAQTNAETPRFAQVDPRKTLSFPRDFGAHPDFRTEWWYATGWLQTPDGKQVGFQVTFFRSATEHERTNPSKFAPKQLIVAHAALSDPAIGKLQHDQRIARAGFGLAQTSESTTDIKLGKWSMLREADGRYRVTLPARDFSFDLTFTPTQPILLQGAQGYSRKGPKPEQASYYYSEPHLQVSGAITRNGKAVTVTGSAWLDHEWSSTVLDPKAVGWDWVGANLDDGRALMAFRIRASDGSSLWQHATLREKDGRLRQLNADAIRFTPVRYWRSPRTQARYPVEVTLEIGQQRWQLRPLQDDQELDSRQSTGAVYWEGAVSLVRDGRPDGRGYLEMTGYVKPLKL
ncbi:MAG: carotenoid 1,2-hydratase [Oxalobacteraceae bacterium]|nr:carotenoid 1,2-hydratase [Oxalobacteraceae bacterium]